MKISQLRQLQTEALQDGKIDFQDAKKIADLAETPADKAAVLKELSSDSFDLSKTERKQLETQLGGKLQDAPSIVGQTLGQMSDPQVGRGLDIKIVKSFSPPGGFDNKFQATAAAKMSGSENAVVVQDSTGKWFAVQSSLRIDSKDFSVNDWGSVQSARGGFDQGTYDDLRQKAREATTDSEKAAAWKTLAAYTYGVDESEINVITSHAQQDPDKININIGATPKGSEGEDGLTANVGTGTAEFKPGAKSAIEVNQSAFYDSRHAQGTLMHEGTHLEHNHQAQKLYDEFSSDPKKGKKSFDDWMKDHKPKIDAETQALVSEVVASKSTKNTEAVAHFNAFTSDLTARDTSATPSKTEKVMLADELNGVATKAKPDEAVLKAETAKLQKFYDALPETDKAKFKAAFAETARAHPGSWVNELKLKL